MRYEKRTKVYGSLAFKDKVTVQEEVIDDALAAVSLLLKIPEINQEQIYILGHSLGGTLIPRIAQQTQKVKGYIVMAGACRPMEDIIIEQSNYLFSLDGVISKEEQSYLDLLKKQTEKVKSPELSLAVPATELPINIPASYWLDLRGYNPALVAQKVERPFLILQGERDYQVTIVDFKLWQAALSKRKDVEFILYPDLNHLFIAGKGKSNPGEYQVAGNVDETVINDIAGWIKKLK